MKAVSFVILLFLLNLGCIVFADDIPCVIRVDRDKISPGKQVQLEIELPDKFGITEPEIPFIDGINIQFIRSLPKVVQKEGELVKSTIFVYKAVPRNAGLLMIGPFAFTRGTDTYRTNQLSLTVEKEAATAVLAQRPQAADLRGHIYVVADVPKTTIYINEKVPVFLKLFTDWIDLENVSFLQKQSEYLLVKDFKDKTVDLIDKDSMHFAVLKYSSSFYAVTSGTFSLEPISVKFNVALPQKGKDGTPPELLNNNSSFYESFIGDAYSRAMELKSEPVSITVLPLPEQDKPKSFRGAVGKFQFEMKADRQAMKHGESVKLTATIIGEGNYDAIAAPIPDDMTGIKITELKTVREKDSVAYDMLLTVQSEELSSLPKIVFSYFDPADKRYVTLSRPIPVTLEKAPSSRLQSSVKRTEPGKTSQIDMLPIKNAEDGLRRPAPLPHNRAGFWLALLFPVFLVPCAIAFDRRQRYLKAHPRYAALLRAMRISDGLMQSALRYSKEGNAEKFYGEVFKAMQRYIGERALISTAGVTGQTVDEYLGPYIGKDLADRIRQIFSECYSARYAAGKRDRVAMDATFKDVRDIIIQLNKNELGGR